LQLIDLVTSTQTSIGRLSGRQGHWAGVERSAKCPRRSPTYATPAWDRRMCFFSGEYFEHANAVRPAGITWDRDNTSYSDGYRSKNSSILAPMGPMLWHGTHGSSDTPTPVGAGRAAMRFLLRRRPSQSGTVLSRALGSLIARSCSLWKAQQRPRRGPFRLGSIQVAEG
jgi:hypothetical protein